MDDALWKQWNDRWNWIRECVLRKGGDDFKIIIKPPLDRERIVEFENETGLKIPADYARFLTSFASSVRFDWYLDEAKKKILLPEDHPKVKALLEQYRRQMTPGQFEKVKPSLLKEARTESVEIQPPAGIRITQGGMGECVFSEAKPSLVENWKAFQQVVTDMHEGCDDPPLDPEFYKTFLPIMGVIVGDTIVMDLSKTPTPILYLDHEENYDPEGVTRIGNGFSDFMTRFSNLGCPGPEIDDLRSFLDEASGKLDDQGETARLWISWLETEPSDPGENPISGESGPKTPPGKPPESSGKGKNPWWKFW